MQPGCFTFAPLLVLAWMCVVVLVRVGLNRSASIQLSISAGGSAISNYNFASESSEPDAARRSKVERYHVPKFMLELYEKNKVKRDNLTRADVVRSLVPKHAGVGEVPEEADDHLLVFDLPAAEEEEVCVGAELRILTLVEIKSGVVSGVERLIKISIYDDVTKTFSPFQKIHISHLNNTWLSFNVTEPVINILKRGGETYLKIIVSLRAFLPYYENNLKLSLMPVKDDFDHDYPILLLSYTSTRERYIGTKTTRKRRSTEEDYEEETNKIWDEETSKKTHPKKPKKNSCRRKPLYINFSEINFDLWIVQPPGYEAYQCQGKCFYPVADHLNPTKHAIVQALLHSVAPSRVSRSCCVPTNLDSISILYVDNKGVLTYRYAYKDMVVLECGCR